jgi:2-polyprenyl-6-methoxyphenol hydroxylase-like FAD-dependent oxidoreductase
MEGLGVSIDGRVALDAQGNEVAEKAMPQVLTSWSRLYEILRALLPAERYVQGLTVQSITTASEAVTVQASGVQGGTQWRADLAIASDGIRSAVRQQFAPQIQPVYAGYVAWRGVCDEAVLSRHTRETVFEKFGFGLPSGEQIIGYPVAGAGNATQPGHRAYNFVWYRPAVDAPLKALLTDADGHYHPGGIAPNKVAWQQIAAMRQYARKLLAPQFAEMIEKTAMPFLQPIFDVASEQIAFDRVALMGDASFVARPHIGMGVTKAAQDAVALCDAIDIHGASPQALKAYEQARLSQGQQAVARARWLGAYMQAQTSAADGATAQRNAQDVLTETAIDLDVYGHLSSFPVP